MRGLTITLLVGTDHHPFLRLVEWADRRARTHPEDTVTVQYGASPAPRTAAGVELMTPEEMAVLVRGSDVVVTHGGPGTIMDTRNAGHLPFVVARNPQHGEHVDNHQMLFAEWAAEKGLVRLLAGTDDLDEAIAALSESGTRAAPVATHATDLTAQRLAALLPESGRRLPRALDAVTVLSVTGRPADTGAALRAVRALGLSGAVVLGDVRAVLTRPEGPATVDCSCGLSLDLCAFWSKVGHEGLDGWEQVDPARMLALHREVGAVAAARRAPRRAERTALLALADVYQRAYATAASVAGASVVVSAGVDPVLPLALSHDRRLDLRLLHLVPGRRSGTSVLTRTARYRGVPAATVPTDALAGADPVALDRAAARLGLDGGLRAPGGVVDHEHALPDPGPRERTQFGTTVRRTRP